MAHRLAQPAPAPALTQLLSQTRVPRYIRSGNLFQAPRVGIMLPNRETVPAVTQICYRIYQIYRIYRDTGKSSELAQAEADRIKFEPTATSCIVRDKNKSTQTQTSAHGSQTNKQTNTQWQKKVPQEKSLFANSNPNRTKSGRCRQKRR